MEKKVSEKIPVADFCIGVSSTDKRVELLSAFHYSEVAALRMHDTRENYQARYEAFAHKPVL